MKTIQYNQISHQGLIVFSTMLLWWGTIRQYYKETNHVSICLDLSYETLLDSLWEDKLIEN
jgi:hypothetical protein